MNRILWMCLEVHLVSYSSRADKIALKCVLRPLFECGVFLQGFSRRIALPVYGSSTLSLWRKSLFVDWITHATLETTYAKTTTSITTCGFQGLSWRKNILSFCIKLELTDQWSMDVIGYHMMSYEFIWCHAVNRVAMVEVSWGELSWRHLWGGSQRGRPAAWSLAPNVPLACGICMIFWETLVHFRLRFGDFGGQGRLSSWLQRRWGTWLSWRKQIWRDLRSVGKTAEFVSKKITNLRNQLSVKCTTYFNINYKL